MRATHTLENIEEDHRDRQDPDRRRKGSGAATAKRRDAAGVTLSRVLSERFSSPFSFASFYSFYKIIIKTSAVNSTN